MIIPGLCSVTFRPMKPLDICKLSQQAGLKSIEWGGDVHVTNEQEAREVAKMITASTPRHTVRTTAPAWASRTSL